MHKKLVFPFFKADPTPTIEDPILSSLSTPKRAAKRSPMSSLGRTGTVHIGQVLESAGSRLPPRSPAVLIDR